MRFQSLLCLLALIASLDRCPSISEAAGPSIVFVYADDLDFDEIGIYDLQNDPFEQFNLADKTEQAETLTGLKHQLERLLDPMPHTFGEFKTD